MAILLLAALIALGLLHVWPPLALGRHDAPWRRWVGQFADTDGWARVVLTLLPWLALCVLIQWLLGRLPFGDLLHLLFDVLVLLYAFGPRPFEADLDALLGATDPASRELLAQRLAMPGETLRWQAQDVCKAAVFAALRRRFGVLLWFFVLGPCGALLYRLAQALGRDGTLALDSATALAARRLANALDWLPAQLMVFTLALVGHWDAVLGAWRRWRQGTLPGDWYRRDPDFLGAAACADIHVEIEAGDGYAEELADPRLELLRLRAALHRALLAWLSVVALMVLGGWIA